MFLFVPILLSTEILLLVYLLQFDTQNYVKLLMRYASLVIVTWKYLLTVVKQKKT